MPKWFEIPTRWRTSRTVTSGAPWFVPAYGIPDYLKEEIQYFAGTLPWDSSAKMQDPSKYHITSFYSPTGYDDPTLHEWVRSQSGPHYPAQIHSLDNFTPSGPEQNLQPIVMRFHAPELSAHAEQMMGEAETRGLSPAKYEGGHKPHITLGHNPMPIQADPPPVQFMTEPLHELHTYYDSLKK